MNHINAMLVKLLYADQKLLLSTYQNQNSNRTKQLCRRTGQCQADLNRYALIIATGVHHKHPVIASISLTAFHQRLKGFHRYQFCQVVAI